MGEALRRLMDKRCYNSDESLVYLGIRRKAFDKHIRPLLPEPTRVGCCKVWERVDLDRAFDDYRAQRNDRPDEKGGKESWVGTRSRESTRGKTAAGTSTKSCVVTDFRDAVSRVMKQRKAGSSSA